MRAWELAERWVAARPGAECLVFGGRRWTWADFGAAVDACARGLIAAGVRPGDRVAMLANPRPEFLVSLLAAGKVGASWLGLSPKHRPGELALMLDDCAAQTLVVAGDDADGGAGAAAEVLARDCPSLARIVAIGSGPAGALAWEDLLLPPEPGLDAALAGRAAGVGEGDEALLLYTSGSTGRPKGVIHTHASLTSNVEVHYRAWGIGPDSRLLLHFPINHAAAIAAIGLASLAGGAALVVMDRFEPRAALALTRDEGVTILAQVPTMFLIQFAMPEFDDAAYASVRRFVTAGSAAPAPMIARLCEIMERSGADMITGYGLSETCGFIAFSDPADDPSTLAWQAGRMGMGEGYAMRILGPDGAVLPAGEVGEVMLKGPFLMAGYLGLPRQTAAAFDADGWLRTGDLGCLDAQGRLRLVGRKSEMYKTGGENVFPREVEEVLEQHPGVAMAAVVKAPDPVFQEVGWAFVTPAPGSAPSAAELAAWCAGRLANFKVPKRFLLRPALPLLPTGKVDKPALAAEIGRL